jgi:dTDP-4-dehydrorhamnose reductase
MLLIIGKESLIGRSISQIAEEKDISWVSTSRRPGQQWVVDLSMPPASWQIPPQATTAIICAASTKLSDCEENPDQSRAINVTATVELARRLTAQGCRVVFLSTNQVFSPNLSTPPDESTPVSPVNEYGRQKAEAEAAILALSPKNIVIRLTKVIHDTANLFQDWLSKFSKNEPIGAYENLFLAPVSLALAADTILQIYISKKAGIFHISSRDAISYKDFAKNLASIQGVDTNLVQAMRAPVPNSATSCTLACRGTLKAIGFHAPFSQDSINEVFTNKIWFKNA